MKTIESKAGNQNGSLYAYGSDRPRFDQQNSYDDDGLEAQNKAIAAISKADKVISRNSDQRQVDDEPASTNIGIK